MVHLFTMLMRIGDDQVNSSGTTSINAFIKSGDWDITSRRSALGQTDWSSRL